MEGVSGNIEQTVIRGQEGEPVSLDALTTAINVAVAGALTQAIGGIHSYVDNQLESQKKANEKASFDIQKLKAKKVQFRFKGNEEQVNFNCSILDQLQEAKKSLPLGSSAAPILKKAEEDLRQRNKLVKLADKSEAGWLAVDEYLADDLAEDSEDDKKIRSAQARAAARKKKTGLKSVPKPKPYQARRPMASPANPAYLPSYANNFRGPIRYNTPYTRPFNPTYQSGPKSSDFCFACGKTGHWRRNCPGYSPKLSKDGQ